MELTNSQAATAETVKALVAESDAAVSSRRGSLRFWRWR